MQLTSASPQRHSKFGWLSLFASAAAILAGCSTPLPPQAPSEPEVKPPAPVTETPASPFEPASRSQARSAREYRKDAASHLYNANATRIFKGRMPPLLYAVGVLQVDIDPRGNVSRLNWMRAPNHAPEVIAEIERTVKAAAPYPVAVNMGGHVTYTDTWLWHKSGRFQLDTLTEGQDGVVPSAAAEKPAAKANQASSKAKTTPVATK